MPINIILPSSTYHYVKFWSWFSQRAKNILKQVSGVEPDLFLFLPTIDWRRLKFKKRIIDNYTHYLIPLTNGHHGLRVHGLTDLGFKSNIINYPQDIERSVGILEEQITLLKRMAQKAKINDDFYPSILTIHIGTSQGQPEQEISRMIQILDRVLPAAKDNQVIINLETLRGDYDIGYELGSDFKQLARIFNEVKDKRNLGITFDFAHTLVAYQGDYQRIKEELERYNLLPLINYLHITFPDWRYKNKKNKKTSRSRFFPWELVKTFFTYQADSHNGLKKFTRVGQEETEKFQDLLQFLVNKSKVKDPHFNVVNLELGMKVYFTDKGATVEEIDYTLEEVRKMIS